MARLLEYFGNHPYLAGGTLILAIIALVVELRNRAASATGVSNNQAIALQNKGALILDVRSAEEFATGHIIDARHIALEQLANSLDSIKKYREKPVVICCEAGNRSVQAVKLLQTQGYTQVFNLSGGIAGWKQDNLPISKGASKAAAKLAKPL